MVAYNRMSDATILAIRVAKRLGNAATDIAKELDVSEGTVRYWVNKQGPQEPRNTPPQCSEARRKAVKARRALVEKLAKTTVTIKNRTRKLFPSTGCMRFALKRDHGIEVSKKTVERDLKAMGFKCFKRLAHTHKNPEDLRRRTLFARRYRYKDTSKWVFTDEKTFTCQDYSSGTEWARKKEEVTGTDASNCCMDTVYVWGAIGLGFRHLVVIRKSLTAGEAARKRNHEARADKERFTSHTYIRRCLSGRVMQHLQDTGSLLQADNHRSHTSKETKEYLEGKGVAWSRDWPARSPDLNPIENLWAYLQQRVSERVPTDANELEQCILAEWNALDQSFVDNYVRSFKGKCTRVAKSNGKPA